MTSTCGLCDRPLDGPSLTDPATGAAGHPACVARRAPQDALVVLLSVLALALAPPIVVWAG